MAGTDELILEDRNIVPEEVFIFSTIGDKKLVWQEIMNYAHQNYKDVAEEWRYYNDGKRWLFKLTCKKKTIFWLGLMKDTFRVTFYFGDKAEPLILESDLPDTVKKDFIKARRFGSLRAITTTITGPSDIPKICTLIDIKLKLK